MANNNNLPPGVRYITGNIFGTKRIGQMVRLRNLLEGLVMAAIGILIVCAIPFKVEVKILFSVVVAILLTIFGVIGIANRSVTEFIFVKIVFQITKKTYHFRSIKNVKKAGGNTGKNGEQLTYAEAVVYYIKTRYEEKQSEGEPFEITDVLEAFKNARF